MCIGVPMQIIEVHEHHAICVDGTQRHEVNTQLVGTLPISTWVMVFLGSAREVVDETEALAMRNAINAVSEVMGGRNEIDHLFADLIDREPQLPPHLQAQIASSNPKRRN